MSWVAAAIAAGAGIAKTTSGIVNAAKTKKIAEELEKTRPEYEISQLAKDDLSLAESELAGGGLSSRAETAYNNLNNQQFAGSLSAILRGGGSVNNVADLYGADQEGRTRLALLNDQMRLQQINNVMKTRQMYRDEQDKEFEFNDFRPWADKSQANAEARKQAQNQIWDGVGTIANAGMNAFGTKNQEKMYDKYFDKSGSTSDTMPNGQQMWQDWKSQQERDNAKQGIYELPEKYRTAQQQDYNVPMFDTEGLYDFLNRGM